MSLGLIRIHNLRNIREIEIEPEWGINLIWGPNGSGKTSILEAIYLLGRGRSFRGRESRPLIHDGADCLDLYAKIEHGPGEHIGLGLRKGIDGTEARVGSSSIKKISDLARTLPIYILTPQSHEILERGPQYRRRFVDWGVFHVEHHYREIAERYRRILQQRNAALRERRSDASVWSSELGEAGERLEQVRSGYLQKLRVAIETIMRKLSPESELQLEWRRGWSAEASLEEALAGSLERDRTRSYTSVGPNRADLVVRVDGERVERRASRGQQKLIVAAMTIAQATLTKEGGGADPVILVDDLPAELDSENRQKLMEILQQAGLQIFVTGVERGSFQGMGVEQVFHVEHGAVV
jgi:DNA replication and repair protein RecF